MASLLKNLSAFLGPLELGEWQYYPEVGSTNDLALDWARKGAQDWSLVLADSQTAGRGREGRHWVTNPGSALAMSLVLRPTPEELAFFPRFTALVALGLIRALSGWGLGGTIKWPNDILLQGRKVAGVLVEADWQKNQAEALVIGLGVNVTPAAVPPPNELRFPATSLEEVLGKEVNRWHLLAEILHAIKRYRAILPTGAFMQAWNTHLAFKDEVINYRFPNGEVKAAKVIGVRPDGQLALNTTDGEMHSVVAGEIEVVDRNSKHASLKD